MIATRKRATRRCRDRSAKTVMGFSTAWLSTMNQSGAITATMMRHRRRAVAMTKDWIIRAAAWFQAHHFAADGPDLDGPETTNTKAAVPMLRLMGWKSWTGATDQVRWKTGP